MHERLVTEMEEGYYAMNKVVIGLQCDHLFVSILRN